MKPPTAKYLRSLAEEWKKLSQPETRGESRVEKTVLLAILRWAEQIEQTAKRKAIK